MANKLRKNIANHKPQLLIFVVAIFIFPIILYFSTEARKNASNRVLDWLPAGLEETRVFLDVYLKHFPEGELLMVSWDGATIEDDRFSKIAERLLAPVDSENNAYFQSVSTSGELYNLLREEPLNLSAEEAKERMQGWLIGKNGQDGCLVAVISHFGSLHRAEAIDAVYRAVQEITKLPSDQVQIAGPSIDSVAIDKISADSEKRLLPFFLLLCFAMLLLFLRSFIPAVFVFFIAMTNSELGPALIYLTGGQMDSISTLISSLVYVLTISAGIYLINYYRETLRTYPVHQATWITIRKALLPCFLSMFATGLGMAALCISGMIPIFNFGLYSSITLVLGTFWLFVTFSAMMQLFPNRRWRWIELKKPNQTFQHRLRNFWFGVADRVRRLRTVIVIVCFLAMILLAMQLPNLKTIVTFHGMFLPNARVIRDYNTLEERIGGLIPIEVVLDIPARDVSSGENEVSSVLEQLWLLQDVVAELRQEPEIDSTISALNFAPILPDRDSMSMGTTIKRVVFERKLTRHADEFEKIHFLSRVTDKDGNLLKSLWRISLRIPAHSHINYKTLLSGISERLKQLVNNTEHHNMKGIEYIVTGGVPLVHRAQQQLLDDLINSFLSAFLTITLTMVVLLRGVIRGIVAMIPNVFPCVIVFGLMSWFGKPVDMGAMMTASVAIGIAVDGTMHFMTWFRRGIEEGMNRVQAVHNAYQHCATAVTQTTFICSFGMLVFCLSEFLPVAQFATLLCYLLLTSIFGGLILLPALLFGPVGMVFEKKKRNK
ncbi:MAG: MMPL family transporter [Planctomycetaceae bacterium]|nr:MMPL family transporter [Planctomycetaceae bacterium]